MKIFGLEVRRSSHESAQTATEQAETRDSIENPSIPVSAANFLAFFGIQSQSLPLVTTDNALQVPAVAAAVGFLPRTMASLPLHAYRSTKTGAQKLSGKIQSVVHDAPNPLMDSFKFRQYFWQQVFTGGRGLAWIERTPQGVEALWPLDPTKTTIKRAGFDVVYQYKDGSFQRDYPAADVIDLPFMLKSDQLNHYGPIALASKAIQLALAMNDYASNFFAGGGVPPLALEGPMPATPDGIRRSMADVHAVIAEAKKSSKPIFPMPPGHKLTQVGYDPSKGQMLEARRFQVEEIARAYQLPPVFLQDLTRATFTNAEQQDLHLVKHLIGQWAEAFEGEVNLKMFGRGRSGKYVEHSLDGLLRGDFKTRMEGHGIAIQNGIRTPDEIRALENLPERGGPADKLYIQGATIPLGTQPVTAANDNNAGNNENGDKNNEAEAA